MYIKVIDSLTVVFPYTYDMLKVDNPNISFPRNILDGNMDLSKYLLHLVVETPRPDNTYVKDTPLLIEGAWVLQWKVQSNLVKKMTDKWKHSRALLVQSITSTLNEVIYQSDEKSRARMATAKSGLEGAETQEWTALDNSKHFLSISDLTFLIKDGNAKQTAIWNEGRPVNE